MEDRDQSFFIVSGLFEGIRQAVGKEGGKRFRAPVRRRKK